MLNKEIKICKIVTFSEEDFISFNLEFSSSGVDVSLENINEGFKKDDFPTIIVGWNNIKKLFPTQRISEKKIQDNVYWIYGTSEDKATAIKNARSIIKNILENWLPDKYITYDAVLDGKFSEFFKRNFKEPYKLFVYFSGKVMYFYNTDDGDKKIIGVSLESLKYSGVDVKKAIKSIMEKYSPICLSYLNISAYINENHNVLFETMENFFWAKYNEEISEKSFHDFMMDVDGDRYIPFLMSELKRKQEVSDEEKIYIQRLIRKDEITEWLSKREIYFDKKYVNDKVKFQKSSNDIQYIRLQFSNKRTITGRINCIQRNLNPQMFAKKGEERKMIISRFKGGKIAVFDYVSFETKIALFLSQDEKFIKKYRDKDLHEETAKIIFNKKSVESKERSIGKSINHALIYGGGEETLKRILENVNNVEKILEEVRVFLEPIIVKSEEIKLSFEEFGHITNSFGTIIRPQKSWATFSNYVSAIAADIVVEKLYEIKEFLLSKKSKFIFQVHDSFIFDIHPDELKIINEIQNLLSEFQKLNFQVNHVVGNNFSECTTEEELVEV